mmetsp:Transcript_24220/g.37317  ORF Transcript_24220/g.37317 Transcript_24220/m.37317 type:complete len:92 (+) Transcript_24220:1285-1560(+)
MQKEIENSKLQMRNFKLSKFLVQLNSLLIRTHRHHKYFAVNQLQNHKMSLDIKMKKLASHHKYSTRFRILKAWASHVRHILHERELEAYAR